MRRTILPELLILLFVINTGFSDVKTKVKIPLKRSYQLPQIAVVNNAQGLQYYAAAPIYTIPTIVIPNQLSLSATPIAKVVLPPSSESKPLHEFQETSTQSYIAQKPAKAPIQYYKQKHRSHISVQPSKRPVPYVNSVNGHHMRIKTLSSVPPKTKVSSLSIQPSVDLSRQYAQEAESNLYPSTVGPPVVSTYGPPKAVDFQYKTRGSGLTGQAIYHKLKGPSHRYFYYPNKKLRVYSHVHKDHIHNHYIPAGHSYPVHKTQQLTKYSAPTYLPPTSSTPPTYSQEITPVYSYPSNVRFPDSQETVHSVEEEPTKVHQLNYSPGGVTQAIIKNPGVINNYDANIPLHVPSKKPYQFEVNEILKNSELHFVQEAPVNNNNEQNSGFQQYIKKVPYQNSLVLDTQQQLYSPVDQSNVIAAHKPVDIYSLPGVNAYQTNHVADQDLGTSETVKVPVAVIRGAHNIAGQGMYGFTVKRQDDSPSEEVVKKTFTPSKRTSDWIPMSGNGVPITPDSNLREKRLDSSVGYGTEYFTKKETKTVRQPIGDIISGKIPEKYSPKTLEGDIIKGKINYLTNSETEKRKGSVFDVYPSASSEILNTGDTSDMVVSSVIKFS